MEGGQTTTSTGEITGDWKPAGKFNGTPYFNCDANTFHSCIKGKKKGKHWKKFIGGDLGTGIKTWASQNRNSNFMLRNTDDDTFIYAHRSF